MSFALEVARYQFGMYMMKDWAFVTGGINTRRITKKCERINVVTGEVTGTTKIPNSLDSFYSLCLLDY